MPTSRVMRVAGAAALLLTAACSSGMMDSQSDTQLVSVLPPGGALNVAPNAEIAVSFNRPMMTGMAQYLALHRGDATGPTIGMSCDWQTDGRTLSCRPEEPLAPRTRYTIHLGGGMMDREGRRTGMERYGLGMGGRWATGAMLGGQGAMMAAGWRCANGSYGMLWDFTTQ